MATNEILPFCQTDTGTNLLTQAEYDADTQRPIGNQPGVARTKLVNKTLRQTSTVAAGLAQYVANRQGTDVTDSLTPTALEAMIAAAVAASAPQVVPVGTVFDYWGTVSDVPSGWVPLMDDTHTIGPAGSGATYAADSYLALFNQLWGVDDATAGSAVQPSRGASAAADWAAAKVILLPPMAGRSSMGAGQGTNLTARTLAETLGEEGHVQTVNELAAHSHSVSFIYGSNGLINAGSGRDAAGFTGTTGSSDPMNVIHPVTVVTKIMFAGV